MELLCTRFESVTMEEEQDIYSDPAENYCRLQRTVTFLKNGGRVTEEWMEEHRLHILEYYERFPQISQTNLEITDPTFRKIAAEAEVLLTNLVQAIHANRFFNVKFYLMLNEHMIKLTEFFLTEDDLESFMSKLSI